MWILAIDSSATGSGSVALLHGLRLCGFCQLDAQRRTAQSLAPAVAELFTSQGVIASQIGLVATTVGPGSFTGLRIGVTFAKTFAYATGAKLVGVSTLEALAHSLPAELSLPTGMLVEAVLNAHREELFVGRFELTAQVPSTQDLKIPSLRRLAPDCLVPAEAWRAAVAPGTVVVGPEGWLPVGGELSQLPAVQWIPATVRADVVGVLAYRAYQAGRCDDPFRLQPVYLRPSYAEEKRSGG